MKTSESVRNPAMDIIRCFALLCVISAHFFLYTDFYYVLLTGSRLYLMTLILSASMICVPLFIMLSGYLLNKKQPVRSYYAKLGKTLSIYCLASVCCYVYGQYLAPYATGSGSAAELISRILSFRSPSYAWYINMYLGLFLLIPYLNLCFHSLPDAASQRKLILSVALLTVLPSVVNVFYYSDGWHFGGRDSHFETIVPDYWKIITPIAYYFLGAHLRQYPLKLRRRTNLLLIVVCAWLTGTGNYLVSYNHSFILGPWQDWDSLPTMILSVLVFNYLAQGDYSRLRSGICRLLARMSDLCLGAFLVSWIFDNLFYNMLRQIEPAFAHRFVYYPLIVPLIFLCSLALSQVLNGIYALLARILSRLFPGKLL